MPSAPKIADRHRLIRRIEIVRQLHAKHLSDADRHIAITAEIKIELEHIRKRRERERYGIQPANVGETKIRRLCQQVGKQYLFGQSEHKIGNAARKTLRIKRSFLTVLKLRDELAVQHDRSRDELGKKSDERQIIHDAVMRRLSPAPIQNKR